MTKEEKRIYSQKYWLENKEELKIKNKTYYEENKETINQQKVVYNEKNKRKFSILKNNAYIKRKYNITREEYDKLLVNQNNRCKCCGKEGGIENKQMLHLDHCHKTGKIRGFLCDNCNRALGMVKDNINTLQEMINYLNSHNNDKI